jgi:Bacterial membrane protein YfhO
MRTARRSVGETLAAHQHLVGGLLLSLLVAVYLGPVLVGGKILSPVAELYGHVPWQGYAPRDLQDYYNPILTDIARQMYPWRVLVRDLIHAGTFPAWSPYALTGVPLYANPQAGVVSLFNVPLWILPLTYGLGVSAALKLAVGAVGAYLLARQLRLGFLAGLLAGVAFAFAAINIVWLAHAEHPGVVAMLPWALWLVERVFARGRPGSVLGLVLVTAIGLGGGHPGMQLHFLFVIAAYALARAAWPHGSVDLHDRRRRMRSLALVTGALAAAGLLMAFMLLPEWRSGADTVGVASRRARELPAQQMPLSAIQTVVFPERWGRPDAYESAGELIGDPVSIVNFNERTFYAGVVALLLACIGAAVRSTWRRTLPLTLVGAFGLAVALHVPGPYTFATHFPILDSVEPERLHFAFELAVALLAAFGLQAMLDAPRGQRWRLAVPGGALLVGIFALATAGASGSDVAHTLEHFLRGTDHDSPGVVALTSIVWFMLLALAVGAALLCARRWPRAVVAIAAALVALATADAYRFAHGLQPMGPRAEVTPPVTPAIEYLQQHRGQGRIAGFGTALPNDWGIVYGLEDVRGYDPPQPTPRMLALWRVVSPNQPSWVTLSIDRLSVPGMRVLSALGMRYLVFGPSVSTPSELRTVRTVYAGPDATIVENSAAAPRALVPASVRVASAGAGTVRAIAEGSFDARAAAVVERGQPGAATLASPAVQDVHGTARVMRRGNASVTVEAQLDRRGLVVLNESLLAGWSVRVDGRPQPATRVNAVMRGVIVPPGRHTIVWSYSVPGLRAGVLISLLTLAGLIAATVAMALAVRRPTPRRPSR